MFEREGGWSFSFSGSGFLGLYHVGVTACLDERAPHLFRGADKIYGSSSGSLSALGWVCGKSAEFCCNILMNTVKEVRGRSIGAFHPSFDVFRIVKKGLLEHLPHNAHKVASGKLGISLTRWPDGQNVVVTEYATRDELIQAVLCSMYVPLYCGIIPPLYRGQRYIDGAFSSIMPFGDSRTTITVSPFPGTIDICPQSRSASFHEVNAFYSSFQISTENFHHAVLSFFPPEPKVISSICKQGYLDAYCFLQRHGLVKQSALYVTPSTLGMKPPAPAASGGGDGMGGGDAAGGEMAGQGDGRPAVWLKAGLQARDIPDFGLVSPELEKALRKACEEDKRLFARFSRSLPGHVLTYLTLPCILPLQYVYFRTQRFVQWLPDLPDDMVWMAGELKVFSCFIFSRLRARLLRAPGSQEQLRFLPHPVPEPPGLHPPPLQASGDAVGDLGTAPSWAAARTEPQESVSNTVDSLAPPGICRARAEKGFDSVSQSISGIY